MDEKDKQITVFAVQSKDPNVRFIEAGSNSDRQRKLIDLNKTVILTWERAIRNDINAIAFNKDNIKLYKYGYNPKDVTVTRTEDLRWYQTNDK